MVRRVLAAVLLGCASCQLILGIDPNVNILGSGGGTTGGSGGGPDGGVPVALVHPTSGTPVDLAVDDAYVFWVTDTGQVGRVAKGGGPPQVLRDITGASLAAIVLDTDHAYFTSDDSSGDNVYAMSKDGGGNAVLASNQGGLTGIAANASGVYWEKNTNNPQVGTVVGYADGGVAPFYQNPSMGYLSGLVADAQNLFWVQDTGFVYEAPAAASGTVILLACGGSTINAFAIDQQNVYYASVGLGTIVATLKGDQPPMGQCSAASSSTLAVGVNKVGGLATNGGLVFWTDTKVKQVLALSTTAPCATPPCGQVLASNQNNPTHIAADASAVYWVTTGDKTIWKLNL
jgi:hypothetical protein